MFYALFFIWLNVKRIKVNKQYMMNDRIMINNNNQAAEMCNWSYNND